MRRKLTLRTTLLTAALLLVAALPVTAEEAPAPIISVVSGLAPDDLLNIRATASAIGKTEARLPSGTALKNYGCNTFNGYPWCKVEDVKNPALVGWAPARYLTPNNPATISEDQATAPAPQANAAQAPASPPGETIASVGAEAESDTAPPPAPVDASATSRAPRQPVLPPPDLAARLGAGGQAAPPSVATITGNAMQDAVGLAYAAGDTISAGDITASATPAEQPAAQAEAPAETADQGPPADDPPAAAAAVPVPTPRPDGSAKAPAAKPETVARLEPKPDQAATTGSGVDGDIPCARYVGQPMTRCAVKVVRGDDGKADVTVTWPDGGTRTISFLGGQPAGADSRGQFRFTREGSLNMIRVGVSERFEITDQQALGD
ncbi:MAG: SH3 domain-containing protein [Alphaproteobacteria bacterium]|nr:SH3 domain-containing protein [Alphaproteobacteria bacterium]